MSNIQAERAINQIYESDTVRSELRDDEASLLLSWGEARAKQLAEQELPDNQFDELTQNLRTLLTAINKAVGLRPSSPDAQTSLLDTVNSAAEAAGFTLTPPDQTNFLRAQSALENQDCISELLGRLKPLEIPHVISQNLGEAVAEIPMSEPSAMTTNPEPEPQPQELPEFPPPQPPQEG